AVGEMLGLTTIPEQASGTPLIWPVPASTELNIVSPFEAGNARISVIDVTGRLLETRVASAVGIIALDTSKWPAGVYQLRLEQEDHVVISKVVKE
ncbi:MAG: T9SS type A sorting domain-containing protein, partial [Flavobacteriales bacterium]|nr:T9SS type A sorting domain-containing protein [Flavobacteriales bacterium]